MHIPQLSQRHVEDLQMIYSAHEKSWLAHHPESDERRSLAVTMHAIQYTMNFSEQKLEINPLISVPLIFKQANSVLYDNVHCGVNIYNIISLLFHQIAMTPLFQRKLAEMGIDNLEYQQALGYIQLHATCTAYADIVPSFWDWKLYIDWCEANGYECPVA